MNDQFNPPLASGTSNSRENIIATQIATTLPAMLDKSLSVLEKMLDSYDPEIRLRAASLIVKTATAIATLKR
jgi:hypothetical protein